MGFKKGQSGNPAGRPPDRDCAAAAIRSVISTGDWEAAAKALLHVLVIVDDLTGLTVPNPNTDGKEKAAAYKALADRAYGMPIQKQIIQEEKAPPVDQDTVESIRNRILGAVDNG